MRVIWKLNGIYNADAQEVAKELDSLGDEYTLKDVVEKARNENSAMHSCFEWDDTKAAAKYREQQAGNMIRMLVYTKEEEPAERTNIRYIVSTGKRDNTYTPTRRIIRNEDEYAALLERALSELRAFKEKYKSLSELEEILSLIE